MINLPASSAGPLPVAFTASVAGIYALAATPGGLTNLVPPNGQHPVGSSCVCYLAADESVLYSSGGAFDLAAVRLGDELFEE